MLNQYKLVLSPTAILQLKWFINVSDKEPEIKHHAVKEIIQLFLLCHYPQSKKETNQLISNLSLINVIALFQFLGAILKALIILIVVHFLKSGHYEKCSFILKIVCFVQPAN